MVAADQSGYYLALSQSRVESALIDPGGEICVATRDLFQFDDSSSVVGNSVDVADDLEPSTQFRFPYTVRYLATTPPPRRGAATPRTTPDRVILVDRRARLADPAG